MLRPLVVALAILSPAAYAGDTATVAPAALLERLGAGDPPAVVLDVRTTDEYAQGHVPGAVNIPYDQLEGRLDELATARNGDVVVYCRSGRRAEIALSLLEKAGFKRLSQLEGDYLAWSAAGLPAATVEEPATAE